jgi:hypothetical protein
MHRQANIKLCMKSNYVLLDDYHLFVQNTSHFYTSTCNVLRVILPMFVGYKGWDVCACILVAVDGVTNAVSNVMQPKAFRTSVCKFVTKESLVA